MPSISCILIYMAAVESLSMAATSLEQLSLVTQIKNTSLGFPYSNMDSGQCGMREQRSEVSTGAC